MLYHRDSFPFLCLMISHLCFYNSLLIIHVVLQFSSRFCWKLGNMLCLLFENLYKVTVQFSVDSSECLPVFKIGLSPLLRQLNLFLVVVIWNWISCMLDQWCNLYATGYSGCFSFFLSFISFSVGQGNWYGGELNSWYIWLYMYLTSGKCS